MVSYPGYPEHSEKGIAGGGGGLVSYLVGLLGAVSYSWQYVYSG